MNKKFLSMLTAILVLCVLCAAIVPIGTKAEGSPLSGSVKRIGGADRYETSSLTAAEGWETADNIVIASAANYADALAGVPLAYALDAPILLVGGDKLDSKTAERIEKLDPEKIYILGGEAAVSAAIEKALVSAPSAASVQSAAGDVGEASPSDAASPTDAAAPADNTSPTDITSPSDVTGPADVTSPSDATSPSDITSPGDVPAPGGNKRIRTVERISGADRFETCLRIAETLRSVKGDPRMIFAVCAYNYPDALAGGPAAAIMGCPVVYIDENADISGLRQFVSDSGCNSVTVLGGEVAVSKAAENRLWAAGLANIERIAGADRCQTALMTVKRFGSRFTGSDVCVATGDSFPDALSGGALAAKLASPLVLVSNVRSVDGLYDYLNARSPVTMYILGGTAAVSDYAVECLRNNTAITTTTTSAPTTAVSKTAVGSNNPYVLKPNYKSRYYIVVYEGSQTVAVYGKDNKGKYSVLSRCMKCSTGSAGRSTPKGLYSVEVKYRWRLMVGDVYAQYACRFYGNYLFHSVLYNRKNDPSSLDAQSYKDLGKKASHGCVRLCVRDAKWIYDNVPNGTQVRVVSAKGPAATVGLPSINPAAKYKGWDPTDPLSSNPYRK